MSSALTKWKIEFEGKPVTTFRYRGRPAWIAREVGEALGYADGKRLVNKITGEWQEEFNPETDYKVISGEELQAFKELQLGPESGPSYTPSMLILFERGLHMVLAKTRKPAGRRLRRLLADKVLPQLIRDGQFDPAREVTPEGELRPAKSATRPLDAAEREARATRRLEYRRLALQQELREMEVDLQRASSILYAADRMGNQTEADAARREAILLLAGRPVDFLPSGIPQAPASPSSPPTPRLGSQQSLPLQQGFPTRTLSSLDAEREKRLAQLANRQSPFGVNPPFGGSADGEGAKR